MISVRKGVRSRRRGVMAKHEDLPIPVFSSLDPVYGDGSQLEEAQLRFDHLKAKFLQVFGHHPDVFARSPGILLYTVFLWFLTPLSSSF